MAYVKQDGIVAEDLTLERQALQAISTMELFVLVVQTTRLEVFVRLDHIVLLAQASQYLAILVRTAHLLDLDHRRATALQATTAFKDRPLQLQRMV